MMTKPLTATITTIPMVFLSEGDQYNRPDSNNTESGYFYARLRHERQLNRQHRLSLESNSTLIAPGQILKAEGDTSQAFANGMAGDRHRILSQS
ncbi:Uncharacterized protein conserved in bacteria [Salmonella enterica subsp. diarizonae]|uniref:Uncharacterized protein conserved in bacteria n=1 Tax=Salmonella diarizonae TaxID=59204 RepID=A0A379U175_SALDZ|nr:Uncharacterized protein conserved in bacteria [Salmonella enterica subsp. diarizonae]